MLAFETKTPLRVEGRGAAKGVVNLENRERETWGKYYNTAPREQERGREIKEQKPDQRDNTTCWRVLHIRLSQSTLEVCHSKERKQHYVP